MILYALLAIPMRFLGATNVSTLLGSPRLLHAPLLSAFEPDYLWYCD
jgi:hypothetical protein